jgi:hypothetical protein
MLRRVLDGFAAAAGALAASAWPSFLQQYRVGLASRIDELARVAAEGRGRAGADVAAFIADQERRLASLRETLAALEAAGPFRRVVAFAAGFDPATARVTWDRFEPALQLGWSGALHAAAGALIGLALAWLVAWPLRRRARHGRPGWA